MSTNDRLIISIPDARLRAAYTRERAAADQFANLSNALWQARNEVTRLEREARRAQAELHAAERDRRAIEEAARVEKPRC